MIKHFCKYIGLILIIIGALILIASFFARTMDNNITLAISLALILIGLVAYIFFNKYIH